MSNDFFDELLRQQIIDRTLRPVTLYVIGCVIGILCGAGLATAYLLLSAWYHQ